MENKQIAATVILNKADGSKRFLMHQTSEQSTLIVANVDEEKTGLANVLQVLKEKVAIDVYQLQLVELTNGIIKDKRMPIFVFEMNENQEMNVALPTGFTWQDPQYFMDRIAKFEVKGMPLF
ncbi:hypothetical protein I568_01208 [Enterococcus columbae DSM 7374 = ATCC 51263]|uniref:Uncharacterized protein n=1 Tax=Enterococcus columbae DSM 7374 = ATCC 51263 TaxID=1121865 RepID=S0KM92_9ENTE|nr:hypothetical protein OMW_01565 [Enterococcus columbae DSM 7374 = ATCC 51263]EOW84049.1 hypothetical protein I568_01208 [Enterococcus columbae DSM 7374 = ATCC 51263]